MRKALAYPGIGRWSRVNALFFGLLALLVVLAVVSAVGAAYVTRYEGQEREEHADQARRRASEHQGDGRQFYKSLVLGTGEQVKVLLFTLQEYRSELGGETSWPSVMRASWAP